MDFLWSHAEYSNQYLSDKVQMSYQKNPRSRSEIFIISLSSLSSDNDDACIGRVSKTQKDKIANLIFIDFINKPPSFS